MHSLKHLKVLYNVEFNNLDSDSMNIPLTGKVKPNISAVVNDALDRLNIAFDCQGSRHIRR